MKDLKIIRKEIEVVDKELIKLFNERMELIAQLNKETVEDEKREEELIHKNLSLVNKEYVSYYFDFYNNLFNLSKEYQKKKKGL
ncbi:MAG TPA: chorismate mutase [Bacilli bacterium]|nr:chorismate mutase [Bacilli bacterium]HOR53432.1 chorismate mutase [Bacilli bacterium]